MTNYIICDDCRMKDICLCFSLKTEEGEGIFKIPYHHYIRKYINTKKNKSNTTTIIFKNFKDTNKDKKRTVYRDEDTNTLYFKNFEDGKKVYIIPDVIEEQEEMFEAKSSMAKNQMDMFEKQLDNFHNLNI